MCGRFTLHTPLDQVAHFFGLPMPNFNYAPSYNIAPTQKVLGITNPKSQIQLMSWGLHLKQTLVINARLETLTKRQTFRPLVNNSRCVILADGFYEWKTDSDLKQPYYITLSNRRPFGFAALFNEDTPSRCTLITMEAQGPIKELHHRMPVLLDPKQIKLWLQSTNFASLQRRLPTIALKNLIFSPVNPQVNSPKHNDPTCIEPLQPQFVQGKLFE